MGSMSTNTLKSPVRRLALVAAPLAVAALALTACNPTHITSLGSPTPEGSHLATPYVEESHAAPSSSASASASDGATSFFKPSGTVQYTVTTLTVSGSTVATEDFTDVRVSGDASSADGALLSTLGLCSGVDFVVTKAGAEFASDGSETSNLDKCGTAARTAIAQGVNSVLQGKITVVENGDEVTIKGGKGSLVLTAAH